tara:strand:- start:3569 stop:6271 length:2703 start_codon:yes stop_codon:yes gene_type:complete
MSKLIEENPNFFSEEFSTYNLKATLSDHEFHEKYINFFAENGVSARISAYFDPLYYLSQYPDVTDAGMEPLEHFVNHGLYESRNPHPLIDMTVIRESWGESELTLEGLARYLISNQRPSAYFDPQFYLSAYRDIANAEIPALLHFIQAGANEKRLPNAFFNYDIYKQHCQKEINGIDLIIDFVLRGDKNKIPFSKEFDYEHYQEETESMIGVGEKLFRHFVLVGQHLGIKTKKKLELTGKSLIASGELYEEYSARISKSVLEKKLGLPSEDSPSMQIYNFTTDEIAGRLKTLSTSEKPVVSILIPVYGATKEVLECLQSLLDSNLKNYPFEIVIADDDPSNNDLSTIFTNIPCVNYIKNSENLGFLLNVNNAVEYCKGEYVILTNSDIVFTENSITYLLESLISDPSIAITGPKILYPNGQLQEAGCSIKRNLETTMIGHLDDPMRSNYNFDRDVDYISGACLCFRLSDFLDAGKFDENLAPAYCEDLDLCLRLTQQKRKIRYVHNSVVFHHLSVSMNSISSLYKVAQTAKNKVYLLEKHAKALENKRKKVIALHLPQYHQTKRNNLWWGHGFTEWTGSSNAKPNYKEHYQPHIPSELGYYDLTSEVAHTRQAELAQKHSIEAFCFYYYNFGNNNEILQRAIETFISSSSQMPFMLCWANENWTRTWDGEERNVLLKQEANSDDEFLEVLQAMERFISSPNYYKVNGKPAVCIYRASQFDNFPQKIASWRKYWKAKYGTDLHIILFDSMERVSHAPSPKVLGADAAVEFPPHGVTSRSTLNEDEKINDKFEGTIIDYQNAVEELLCREHPGYIRYPSTFPSWDNTPRRQDTATVFKDSHPSIFQVYFETKLGEADLYADDEKLIFVNAWNEWGEGTHLEPDLKYGASHLQIIDALIKRNV